MQRRGDQGRIAGADSEVEDAGPAGVDVEVDAVSECLHTISGTQVERGESFGDEGGEKLIKSESILTALECRIRVEGKVGVTAVTEGVLDSTDRVPRY